MAKRNELGSLLGCLNSGNARGREDIAFGDLIFCDQFERFPLQPNIAACDLCSLSGFPETSTILARPSREM